MTEEQATRASEIIQLKKRLRDLRESTGNGALYIAETGSVERSSYSVLFEDRDTAQIIAVLIDWCDGELKNIGVQPSSSGGET